MDTTTIRQIAQVEAVALFLAVLITYPMLRKIHIDLSKISARPLIVACLCGIAWFVGLYLSTGQESRSIPRGALVPVLTVALFLGVNSGWLWFGLLLKHSISIEPIRTGDTVRIIIRLIGRKNGNGHASN